MSESTRKKKSDKKGKPVIIPHKGEALTTLFVLGVVGLGASVVLTIFSIVMSGMLVESLLFGLFLATIGGGLLGAYFLFQGVRSQLVLDSEGLALEQGDKTLGFIPYDNIASVEVERRFIGGGFDIILGRHVEADEYEVLAIVLIKYTDPDTFWPNMEEKGRTDIEIRDGFVRSLGQIRNRLIDGMNAQHGRKKR